MGVLVIYRGEGRVIIVEYVYWNRLCVMIVGKRLYIGYVLEYVWVCKGIEVLEIIVWIERLKCFKECVENW